MLAKETLEGSAGRTRVADDSNVRYVFGAFTLDPRRRTLKYGATIVAMSDRLFQILLALVRANGATLSREELHSIIWPGGAMPDNNLSQHVYLLRKTLGERAGDRLYIMTSHGRGFRFVAPISIVSPPDGFDGEPVSASPGADVRSSWPGVAAFRLYSRACSLLDRGSPSDLMTARDDFETILKLQPNYAPAFVGSARTSLLLLQCGYMPTAYVAPRAKTAIICALKAEPHSAAAHATLSALLLFADWNVREAKRELDKALELDAHNALVRVNGVWFYIWTGDIDKAVAEMERVVVNEPSSVSLQILLARAMIYKGRYADAIATLSAAIEGRPEFAVVARRLRAEALLCAGYPTDAILDLLLCASEHSEEPPRLSLLSIAHAANREWGKARAIYEGLLKAAQSEFVPQTSLVPVALQLGDRDAAMGHFETAVTQREATLPLLRHSPWIAPLQELERYKRISRALGF